MKCTYCAALALAASLHMQMPMALAQTAKPLQDAFQIPAALLGSWGQDASDCTDADAEGRLHVTAKALEFVDSKLSITRVSQMRDGWTRVEGISRMQGKRGGKRVSLDLRIQSQDILSLRNGPQKPDDFVRCKPSQLQG